MTAVNAYNPINVASGAAGNVNVDFGTIVNGADISTLKLFKHRALFSQYRTDNA